MDNEILELLLNKKTDYEKNNKIILRIFQSVFSGGKRIPKVFMLKGSNSWLLSFRVLRVRTDRKTDEHG